MVEIIHYEQANHNKTIGYVDIRVPILKPTVMIFRKIAHVQSGDRRWFNLSSFSREKQDGSKIYLKHAELEIQAYNTQLMESLNDKVKEFCKKNGIESLQPMNFEEFPTSSSHDLPF